MSEKCYSHNEEEYHADYSVILDHFSDHYEIGDQVEFWEAEPVSGGHERFLNAWQIIESMQEQAYEEAGEFSDGYLNEVTKDQGEELKTLAVEYLDKVAGKPTFFTVQNVKKVAGWWDGEDVQSAPMLTESEARNLTS